MNAGVTTAMNGVLERIRSANGGARSVEDAEAAWAELPREYIASPQQGRAEVLALLEERLIDYDVTVTHTSPAELTQKLGALLQQHGLTKIVIPAGIGDVALPEGIDFVEDRGLTHAELNAMQAVLTRCTVAIAETGSLVLQSGPGIGRRALTLVPDVHVCVVKTAEVVATVPEAFAVLDRCPALPVTFVSGPSATADIEMTRVKGVHGPRFLHVLLVGDDAAY